MNPDSFRTAFFDWFETEFGRTADLTDGQTHMMFQAFRAGFTVGKCDHVPDLFAPVVRSPIQERQTPASARDIARQLRREVRRATFTPNSPTQINDRPPEPMGEFDDRY